MYFRPLTLEEHRHRPRLEEMEKELLAFALGKERQEVDALLQRDVHGRPYLIGGQGLHLSFAHNEEFLVLLVLHAPCGIDVEKVRPFEEGVLHRVLSPMEQGEVQKSARKTLAFFQYFTLKEAYGKALGKGLCYPLRETSFSLLETRKGFVHYAFVNLEGTHVVALCVVRPTPLSKEELKIIPFSG